MMLVKAEAVEAEIVGHLEFVEIPVQVLGDLRRMAKLVVGRRHPDALVTIAKVIGQVAIPLHVKPDCFHGAVPFLGIPVTRPLRPARVAAATLCKYESSALAIKPSG